MGDGTAPEAPVPAPAPAPAPVPVPAPPPPGAPTVMYPYPPPPPGPDGQPPAGYAAYPPGAYPPGQPMMIMQPMAVQQKPVGYHEGTCICGGDLGPARWTIVAWVLCIFFCPFNFCYPYCQPEARYCQRCSKEYIKP